MWFPSNPPNNKNHQIIIKALAKLNNTNVHYAIAGVGDNRDYLIELAKKLGVYEQLHLLGFRNDIPELNHSADVFCFPSLREGLPVSLIEVMACGLPVICSRIRGNTDLIYTSGGYLFDPHNVEDCMNSLMKTMNSDLRKMGDDNKMKALKYSVDSIVNKMKFIYES